jgi:hypothetical protein
MEDPGIGGRIMLRWFRKELVWKRMDWIDVVKSREQ